jgi:NAD(P)-dependent dehydrogenase (short-subunit alcohol dehydrogenase family)
MFKQGILQGKVAYVSGGTSGINLGIAIGFAQQGAKVAVVGRNEEKAQAAAAEIRAASGGEAIALTGDVRDYDAVEATLKATQDKFGKIDIVVAGAAGNFPASVINMSSKGFKTVVDIDLIGTFNVFRAAFEYLNQRGASLIAITAGQAVNPRPFQAHVCAAKAGVNMLVKCLAMEWGPAGIRVNAISPGPIEGTEGVARLAPTEAVKQHWIAQTPLRRFGRREEIANAAIYLSSPLAEYITGTVLDCEGGWQLGDASADCLVPMDRTSVATKPVY